MKLATDTQRMKMMQGDIREARKKEIQSQIDATKQALMKDIAGGLSSVGQAFVTGGV